MTCMEIAEQLQQEITTGKCAPGRKLSARGIAERFAVSYLTGNRALNILTERGLVRRKPRGGSYVNGEPEKNYLIGYSIEHYLQNAFNQTAGVFRKMLLNELRKYSCKVRMLSIDDWNSDWLGDLDALLFSHEIDKEQQEVAESLGIPVIQFYGETIRNHPFHQVVIDPESGYRELFRHVSPERFRRAVIVTGEEKTLAGRGRLAERFLRDAGFSSDQIEFIIADNLLPERNWPLWKELGKRCRGCFIFTCGDYLAAGLVSALMNEEIAIGRDVSLAGYDNLEEYGFLPFGKPLIKAVGYSRKDVASAIAKLLRTLIRDPGGMNCQTILLIPTHLVFRETMRPKSSAGTDPDSDSYLQEFPGN